jgi:glycosyltransferase involved in cell wall biosynthesis
MRIACLNNYPLEKMRRLAARGEIPGQHVWGLDALEHAGHTLEIAPFHEARERHPLGLASRWSRQAFGQLDQQWSALIASCDAFYCADSRSARGIALLGRWLRRPLVSVIHHSMGEGALNRAVMRGSDAVLCLSPMVCEQARRLGAPRAEFVRWGPDLSSPLYARTSSEELGIVSAGKNERDLATLIEALRAVPQPALIYDLERQLTQVPAGVQVVRAGGAGADPDAPGAYLAPRVLEDLARASAVAIPLRSRGGLAGLTEVNDALAFGKPVIMTRAPTFPFDLEREGFGLLVEPGDVAGWSAALRRLADAGLRRAMGERARRFAASGWNYAGFCDALVRTFAAL